MATKQMKTYHISVVCEFTVKATSRKGANALVLNEPDFNGSDHCILDNVRLYEEGKDDVDLVTMMHNSPYDKQGVTI